MLSPYKNLKRQRLQTVIALLDSFFFILCGGERKRATLQKISIDVQRSIAASVMATIPLSQNLLLCPDW